MKIAPLLSVVLLACARPGVAEPVACAHAPPPPDHVYRLDFVFTASDGNSPAKSTAFTLNLEENEKGDTLIGRNVPLTATPNVVSPRQDVGLKVRARYSMRGDDLLLAVETELSAVDGASDIRKLVTRGDALAHPGKSTLVASLDDDHKRYELDVTPTLLR